MEVKRYNTSDYYKYYLQDNIRIPYRLYSDIIQDINRLLIKNFYLGKDIVFPFKLGKIELRKYPTYSKIVDGKLKDNYSINWKKTKELWANDKEARENKTLIRIYSKYNYKIHYSKKKTGIPFQKGITFSAYRAFKRGLVPLIHNQELDAYLFNYEN